MSPQCASSPSRGANGLAKGSPALLAAFDESADQATILSLLGMLSAQGPKKNTVAEQIRDIVVEASNTRSNFLPLKAWNLAMSLKAMVEDNTKKGSDGREGALLTLLELSTSHCSAAKAFECLMLSLLGTIMDLLSDKVKAVQVVADTVLTSFVKILSPLAVRTLIIPSLLDGLNMKKTWQTKVAALNILAGICSTLPLEVASQLASIIPILSETVHDVKEQVKKAAYDTMIKACMCVGNRDIEPFVPSIVGCVARPEEVGDCVHKLGSTTFVSQVQIPTLAIIVPLLRRGLREGATAIKRKAALIIDNMSKLVEPATEAEIFLPLLLPELKKCSEEVSDADCRNVCGKAMAGLRTIEAAIEREAKTNKHNGLKDLTKQMLVEILLESMPKLKPTLEAPEQASVTSLLAAAAFALCGRDDFDVDSWRTNIAPYVAGGLGAAQMAATVGTVDSLVEVYRVKCEEKVRSLGGNQGGAAVDAFVDDTVGEVLCDCQFTLAYGAKILLNQTRLKLYRAQRYALCGPIGIGKSTLMRSIASGQLEGFPSSDDVRTVFVKHDIEPELLDYPTVDYVLEDKLVQKQGCTREQVIEALKSFGFTDAMRENAVYTLSGGWKMKLALARATLVEADILLLDEPTNHLDVANQAWITNFVLSQTKATIIVICHDSAFVNKCCTHIVHFEARKLKIFHGNLDQFIEKCPEVKEYYEPHTDDEFFKHKMKFPEPGYLEGVKVKDKAILKCYNVAFTYPKCVKSVINGISIFVSLASRVAVIGPNGAGKSTLIKVLTGELEPTSGNVWKHPNLRIAYVAQHAFHHIESHLQKTPCEYIQWRYAIGEDREAMNRADRKMDDKDTKEASTYNVGGQQRVVEKLIARRKARKTYEYEVHWKGKQPIPDETTWLPREKLEDMGYAKLLNEIDAREAAAAGLWCKPLTQDDIARHLEECGLDREAALHTQLNSLSGGQKVKVVLGACTWNNPHVIILDEPTNYLDRTSLAGLADAIKTFQGGILLISHHRDFLDALCTEQWAMKDGLLTQIGGTHVVDEKVAGAENPDEIIDAAGNVVKIKKAKKVLTRKEQKDRERFRKLAKKNGEAIEDDDDDDEWYEKLKAQTA